MNMFTSVSVKPPKTAAFDLSHMKKLSTNMGQLVPILVQEVIPGDKFSHTSRIAARMAPMLAPIMEHVKVKTDFFFVPNRIVWTEWEDFITKGRLGTSAPVHPTLSIVTATKAATAQGSLMDFMGMPDLSGGDFTGLTIPINALPFRAYQLIYDEYFRNQNVTASLDIATTSGATGAGAEFDKLTTMRQRGWSKNDRFVSALPSTQRGPQVLIPMTIDGDDVTYAIPSAVVRTLPPGALSPADGDVKSVGGVFQSSTGQPITLMNVGEINNSSITIIDFRRAERLQRWMEKSNVAGGRYKEHLKIMFNVNSSDARLQRPEYLGGGRQAMVISEVLSTATDSDLESVPPQGNMAGHGASIGSSNKFRYRAEEHGWIIGIMSIVPKPSYMQGIPKQLQRDDTYDYATPDLAQIGDEPIYNKELMYDIGNMATPPEGIFGYTPRYSEYKFQPSTVHGEMKTTLDFWHLARKFESQPVLDTAFIECHPDNRIFAVTDGDHIYVQVVNNTRAIRPLPYFGTPTL